MSIFEMTHKDYEDEKWYFTDYFISTIRSDVKGIVINERIDGTLNIFCGSHHLITMKPLELKTKNGDRFELTIMPFTFKTTTVLYDKLNTIEKYNRKVEEIVKAIEHFESFANKVIFRWENAKGKEFEATIKNVAHWLDLPLTEQTYHSIYNYSEYYEWLLDDDDFKTFIEEKQDYDEW